MKLDRNSNPDGRGKYALIKLRDTDAPLEMVKRAVTPDRLAPLPVDLGDTPETEFFVIRLKDKYAAPALHAYADAVLKDNDIDYAFDIRCLANRSSRCTNKRNPD